MYIQIYVCKHMQIPIYIFIYIYAYICRCMYICMRNWAYPICTLHMLR